MPKVSVGRAELDTRTFVLYRFYDRAGVLLYIGITVDFRAREAKHAKYKAWWPHVDHEATVLEHYVGERAARAAETAAIKSEKPIENDQHNEFVELGSSDAEAPWSASDFAEEVFGGATPDEIDAALHDNKHDFDNNGRTERECRNAAAFSLLMGASWERKQSLAALSTLRLMLDYAGDNRWTSFARDLVERRQAGGTAELSEHDTNAIFLRALAAGKAAEYLGSLPEDEADGWRDCAMAAEGWGSDTATVEIFAAHYAHAFKAERKTLKGLCSGPHHSGARCSRTDLTETVFEICPICEAGTACSGHLIWCEKHASMAWHGRLALFDDSRFAFLPIKNSQHKAVAA